MKLLRLSGRKNCERVKTKGRLIKGRHIFARFLAGPPREKSPGLYVGTVTSTKLDKSAVKRNRMRRRAREALRITAKNETKNISAQLLLLPRSTSLKCNFSELVSDAQLILGSLPTSS